MLQLSTVDIVVLSAVFAFGCWCTALQFRLKRTERIARKAHLRLDRLTGTDWVTTGEYKSLEEL